MARLVDRIKNPSAVAQDTVQLARELERARAAQEAAGIGIHDYDIIADDIFWDDRVRALWGVSADEPINFATFAAGVHPEDLPAVERAVERAIAPGGTGRYFAEYRVINRKDGKTRTVEATGTVQFENGQAVRLIGTVRDVTAERALHAQREADQHFIAKLTLAAPVQLYVFDLIDRRNVYLGPHTETMLGRDQNSLAELGSNLIEQLIHPDDAQRVWDYHGAIRDGHGEEPFEVEYRMQTGEGRYRWFLSREVVFQRDAEGRPSQLLGAALDITGRVEAARNESLVRAFSDRANDMFWLADADTGQIVYANKTLADCLGTTVDALLKRTIPLDNAYTLADIQALIEKIDAGQSFDRLESVFKRDDGHPVTVELGVTTIKFGGRRFVGMVGRDVSEQRALERHRELLINELNHRVKNMLATVQSVTLQTLADPSLAGIRKQLESRLLAMARSHDLLTNEHWEGAELLAVAQASLQPYLKSDTTRIAISGPALRVEPRFALAVSMALHELATNAAKYGALSVDAGQVDLRWAMEDELTLIWEERGGPKVTPPTRKGFGSRLLEHGLTADFDGTLSMDFAPTGLRCALTFPWPPQ